MKNGSRAQEISENLFGLKSICILICSISFMIGFAYAEDDPIRGPSEFIELTSHADRHLVGQTVAISGKYFDSNHEPLDGSIKLRIFYGPQDDILVFEDQGFSISARDGMFFDSRYIPEQPGRYLIQAESQNRAIDSTHITVVDFFSTFQFLVLIAAVSSLIILLTIVASFRGIEQTTNPGGAMPKGHVSPKDSKTIRLSTFRVARFALVSIIVFSMISFFYFSDIEYGRGGTIGIVLYEFAEERKFDEPLDLNWVLHIGGVSQENYKSGLTIPIYILIFGVFGGYLRFFYYTANKWLKREVKEQLTDKAEKIFGKDIPDGENAAEEKYNLIESKAHEGIMHPILARVLTNRVMGDLSLLFIAPILAVMMYFVLSQSGLNESEHIWTFAVTSFAAGLFTEKVIASVSDIGQVTKKDSEK